MTTSLPALIERLESAKEGSRDFDLAIAMATGHDLSTGPQPTWAIHGDTPVYEWSTGETPEYSTSLDAALTLYKTKPEKISTDPLKACIEALCQRM